MACSVVLYITEKFDDSLHSWYPLCVQRTLYLHLFKVVLDYCFQYFWEVCNVCFPFFPLLAAFAAFLSRGTEFELWWLIEGSFMPYFYSLFCSCLFIIKDFDNVVTVLIIIINDFQFWRLLARKCFWGRSVSMVSLASYIRSMEVTYLNLFLEL